MNLTQLKEKFANSVFCRNKRLQSKVPLKFPFVVNLELTNICTENCIWCPQESMTRPRGFMQFDLFKKLIDEMAQHQKLRRLYIHWMGEPLLHPQFLDFIEYAKKKNVAEMIVIATNGVLLNESNMKKLIELQIDELYISIDAGSAETYKQLKNTDNFDTISENIKRASALKKKMKSQLPYLKVKFLETDANFHEKQIFKKLMSKVVDEVYYEKDLSTWDGTNERVNKYINGMKCYLNNYGNLVKRYPCDRLWYSLAVNWEGKVFPCVCDWNGNSSIGDANSELLGDVWYNDQLVNLRKLHLDGRFAEVGLCRECTKWGKRNMGDWLTNNKERAISRPR